MPPQGLFIAVRSEIKTPLDMTTEHSKQTGVNSQTHLQCKNLELTAPWGYFVSPNEKQNKQFLMTETLSNSNMRELKRCGSTVLSQF